MHMIRQLTSGGVNIDDSTTPNGRLMAMPVDLCRRRSLHWLQLGVDGYVPAFGEGGWRTLEPHSGRWSVVRLVPDSQRQPIAAGLSLAYVQGVAGEHTRQLGGAGLINARAKWRQEPASYGQVRLMCYLGIPATSDLTKGQAAALTNVAKASRALRKEVAHA
jgi:hypothetical protein